MRSLLNITYVCCYIRSTRVCEISVAILNGVIWSKCLFKIIDIQRKHPQFEVSLFCVLVRTLGYYMKESDMTINAKDSDPVISEIAHIMVARNWSVFGHECYKNHLTSLWTVQHTELIGFHVINGWDGKQFSICPCKDGHMTAYVVSNGQCLVAYRLPWYRHIGLSIIYRSRNRQRSSSWCPLV